jgi:hypothetical protein
MAEPSSASQNGGVRSAFHGYRRRGPERSGRLGNDGLGRRRGDRMSEHGTSRVMTL